jgi:hypothetical protein
MLAVLEYHQITAKPLRGVGSPQIKVMPKPKAISELCMLTVLVFHWTLLGQFIGTGLQRIKVLQTLKPL